MGLIALAISAKSIRRVPLPHPRYDPGSDVLGARISCPQRAEGPQSADRSDTPEPPTPPPEPRPWERCPGSADILPATGRRPAKRRQERHTRATHSPARGTTLGAMSWERGYLARNGPKARKAPTGATHPSHPLPRPSHDPGSDVLGARVSCPQRAEGPQSADRSDTPEPPTPPPEVRPWERCPESAGIPPACPWGGPSARCGVESTTGAVASGRWRVAVCQRLSPVAGASVHALAPFPVAARRTARAALPHPALPASMPSSTAGRASSLPGRPSAARCRAAHRGSDIAPCRRPCASCAITGAADAVREHPRCALHG